MFALGVCLMATVSSVNPTAAAPAPSAAASTYDDAACDLSDSGEFTYSLRLPRDQ